MEAARILEEAAGMVGGERRESHGELQEGFQAIAGLWNAYLAVRRDPGAPLGPADVALMMQLLKVARTQSGATNLDDFMDAAGYAGIAGELSL